MLKANLKNQDFIKAIKDLKEGESIDVVGGKLTVEARFDKPTHFNFHQRIFPAGMILKKEGRPTRIFVPAALVGITPAEVKPGEFVDRQIKDGKILPADPETQFQRK